MSASTPRLVHRTATVRLRVTRRQAGRCYGLLRSAGDVWAWLLDSNRQRRQQGEQPVTGYRALCRQLTSAGPFGELSVSGARSVLQRYSDAWFQAAKRRKADQQAGFPRRKRALVPVRFYRGTFLLEGDRVRLPVARGRPELWVRLARPLPYPAEQVRAVTLLHDGGQLWLAVTAAIPIQQDHDLDPGRVAGVDLGVIHPYAVVTEDAGLLVSGRALRAESYLHLADQKARQANAARRAPKPGQRGSRRWRRHRLRVRRMEARHRRRVHQAHHEAARQVIAFAVEHQVGTLVVGDLAGITNHDAGRVQNLRLRQWRRTHLLEALRDKAEQAGWWCGWWTSAAPPPPAPPATGGSSSQRAAGSPARTASPRGIGIWWVPATSPPRPAADPQASAIRRLSSTVGPAGCRHGVTDAATSTTSGGVGPAWPRATHPTIRRRVGVARHASPTWRLARIKQRCLSGQRCLEGHMYR
jgi:IS605 OrfB family transposase